MPPLLLKKWRGGCPPCSPPPHCSYPSDTMCEHVKKLWLILCAYYVTLHEKTKRNVPIIDFELRSPLPSTTINLNYWSCKFEVSSPCRFGDWAKIYPDHPYYNFAANTMKLCHLCCTWKPVYSPFNGLCGLAQAKRNAYPCGILL